MFFAYYVLIFFERGWRMPTVNLTKRLIDNTALSTEKPKFLWDSELKGFGMRVTKTKKVFVVQARVNTTSRRITIGNYGAITLKQARDEAQKRLTKMIRGEDPSIERKKNKASSVTLEQVVKSYLSAKTLKPLSIKDINTHVNLNFIEWKNRPLATVTRAAVKKKFLDITKRSPAQANQAMRNFRAIWNYAIAEYRYPDDSPIFKENPVNIISEQKIWNRIKPKDSKIPTNKIGIAWNLLQNLRRSPVQIPSNRTILDAAAFIFLTGCRLSEAVRLKWYQVNFDEGWWHLDDSKNHSAVTFPLSELACEIIADRPQLSPFVFGSDGKYGHITEIRTPMKKISNAIGTKVTPHDLRRTFKAMAIENNIELWRANLLMNHKESGVAIKHYVETSDLLYFRPEVNIIANWILSESKIAKNENIIKLPMHRKIS